MCMAYLARLTYGVVGEVLPHPPSLFFSSPPHFLLLPPQSSPSFPLSFPSHLSLCSFPTPHFLFPLHPTHLYHFISPPPPSLSLSFSLFSSHTPSFFSLTISSVFLILPPIQPIFHFLLPSFPAPDLFFLLSSIGPSISFFMSDSKLL